MLFWQVTIFLTIVGSAFIAFAVSRVVSALWVIWTLTAVVGSFPLYVAGMNLFSISVSAIVAEAVGEWGAKAVGSPHHKEFSTRANSLVSMVALGRSRTISFEEWFLQRNDLVRAIRREMRTSRPGAIEKVRLTLGLRTRVDFLAGIEKRLLDPKMEYRAFRRLPHTDPSLRSNETFARPRKRAVRGVFSPRLAGDLLMLAIPVTAIAGTVLSVRLFSDWDQNPFLGLAVFVGTLIAMPVQAVISRQLRESGQNPGPRWVWEKVEVPDDPRLDFFRRSTNDREPE